MYDVLTEEQKGKNPFIWTSLKQMNINSSNFAWKVFSVLELTHNVK